jgi:hypothetical protein
MLINLVHLVRDYIPKEYYAISSIVFLHGGDAFTRKIIHSWPSVIKFIIYEETNVADWGNEYGRDRKRILTPDRFKKLKNGGCLDLSHIMDDDFYHGWVIIRLPSLF